MIVQLFVLLEHRLVTDRQADRHEAVAVLTHVVVVVGALLSGRRHVYN